MTKLQPALNKTRVCICCACLLTLLLAGCGNSAFKAGKPALLPKDAGQIVIQLFESPGNIYPSLNGTPTWTLYHDGTLIYQRPFDRSPTLLQAKLQPSEIQHILDVVVTQDAFFRENKTLYGTINPDSGYWLLTVNASVQQKTVYLSPEEDAPPSDQHLFAILHFLLSYQPVSAHPYAAPGVALLVIAEQDTSRPSTRWPYSDISLAQVAAEECPIFYANLRGHCSRTGASGIFPIYGQRGTDLLNGRQSQQIWETGQRWRGYLLVIWPLLPDNLVAQSDGKQWVQTTGFNGGRWLLLDGTQ